MGHVIHYDSFLNEGWLTGGREKPVVEISLIPIDKWYSESNKLLSDYKDAISKVDVEGASIAISSLKEMKDLKKSAKTLVNFSSSAKKLNLEELTKKVVFWNSFLEEYCKKDSQNLEAKKAKDNFKTELLKIEKQVEISESLISESAINEDLILIVSLILFGIFWIIKGILKLIWRAAAGTSEGRNKYRLAQEIQAKIEAEEEAARIKKRAIEEAARIEAAKIEAIASAKERAMKKEEPIIKLKKLKQFLDDGILDPEEYEMRRKEIVKNMSI